MGRRVKALFGRALRRAASFVDPLTESLSPRTCPICDFKGNFRAFGLAARPDSMCPGCGSLERHRLLKLLFDRRSVLPENCRLLHFAPEHSVTRVVRPLCAEYVTADFMHQNVDLPLNIEAIDLEDGRFDAVICSHVLEHVDDRAALGELFRILGPGGLAMLAVPIVYGWETTYEDPSITDDADRLLHFGQRDHVRRYGKDFRQRVRRAGFDVEEFVAEGVDTVTYSLVPGDRIFLARKPMQAHET